MNSVEEMCEWKNVDVNSLSCFYMLMGGIQFFVICIVVKQQRHSDEKKKRRIRRDVAKFGQSPEL